MSKLNDIINHTMGIEGGEVNDPDDRGGLTKYGITQATWAAAGNKGSVSDATPDQARALYMLVYIQRPGFAPIVDISDKVCAEMFDTGVNMGVTWPGKFLQEGLNVLDGSGLTVDGKVGPATLAALKAYLKKRPRDGEGNLVKILNVQQGQRYIDIVKANPTQRKFVNGWFAARIF